MSHNWDAIISNAEKESTDQFTDKASSLVKLTNEQIKTLIPKGVEQKKFAQLMKIIDDSTLTNEEKALYIQKVSDYSKLAVSIIKKIL